MERTLPLILLVALITVWLTGCAPATTPAPTATPVPPTATPVPATATPSAQDLLAKFHWFGTSAFVYSGSKVIYFDPVAIEGNLPKADIILVTHAHTDHWSVADIKKIIGPNTVLIIGPNVEKVYETDKANLGIEAKLLNEGDKTEVDGVSIEAVPAYEPLYHPKGTGGVGYIVKIDGLTLYMAGGTDAYPDMANYTSDIAFIPVYSKAEAQAMAEIIPAKMIILEHTSVYAAQAVANLFNQQYGPDKSFIALEEGPNP